MKKVFFLILFPAILGIVSAHAQVTIGANTAPEVTLQVIGSPANATVADGVIAPQVTLAQLQAKDAVYTAAKNGVIVYVTDATGTPAGKTINVTVPGYYYFDGVALVWKGFGGSIAPYQQIHGKVVTVRQAAYTVQADDYAVISNYSAGVTITFPALTASEAGRVILVFNNNTVSTANTLVNVIGNIGQNQLRGGTVLWTGTEWAMIDK